MDREAAFDPSLFSPEELAMMRDANGATNEIAVKPDLETLQAQFTAVARLVAEGGERERQLRALVNDLTLLAKANAQQQQSIYAQTQTLAQIVIKSSEREVHLQENLEALRGVIMGRVQQVTDGEK